MTTDPDHLTAPARAPGAQMHTARGQAPPGCLRPLAAVFFGRELAFRRLGADYLFGAAGFFAGAAGLAGAAPLPAGASLKNSTLGLRICLKLASEIT